MAEFDNKVVIVTGAGSGMGSQIARDFVMAGAVVIFVGRRIDALNAVVTDLPPDRAIVRALDVSDRVSVNAVVGEVIETYNRVDILINNAGLNTQARGVADIAPDDWDYVVNVNLNGAFNMTRAVLPTMRAQHDGLIIHISSTAGVRTSQVAGAAYSASKHAMVSLSNSINLEEWEQGIRSTAICPGEVNTPILDKRAQPPSDDRKSQMIQIEDISATVLYVARLPQTVTVPTLVIKPTYQIFA